MANADAARLTVDRALTVAAMWLAVLTELRLLDLELQMRAGGACTEDGIVDAVAWSRAAYRDWRVEALAELAPQIEAALAEPDTAGKIFPSWQKKTSDLDGGCRK